MTLKDGKPCKKCGTSAWYKHGGCIYCAIERSQQYYKDHTEQWKENSREWYKKNKKRAQQNSKNWAAKHPNKTKKIKKAWKNRNKEKVRQSSQKYYQENKDRSAETTRLWRQRNPEKTRAASHRRRARLSNAGQSFTAKEWNNLCKKYNYRCLACGKKKKLEVDHIIPLSKNGSASIDNIQPLCRSCNSKKGTNEIDYR